MNVQFHFNFMVVLLLFPLAAPVSATFPVELILSLKIIGWDVMIRVQCSKNHHPGARFMEALKELDLEVNHASLSVVNDLMIQQATVKMMGSQFFNHDQLKVALMAKVGDCH
ncbi:unnamed protein product [Microthlaspi erraticum]|uniref:Transcription factor n=1 Tax=Microthlaspi erraticum TaxID=1685480 RepID=A0A6D2HLY1_9BRAS|nr:unnamed protein product [Microthlaspi erraticum]